MHNIQGCLGDSITWKFLYYMMEIMGFSNKWINWIKECLESATISILVIGSPTKEFIPLKGLRQGE